MDELMENLRSTSPVLSVEMIAVLWFSVLTLLTNNRRITVLASESNTCGTLLPPLPYNHDHKHSDRFSVSSSFQLTSNCEIFPKLRDILKQLGIFSLQASLCSDLKSITRTTYPHDKSNSLRKIAITLEFVEDVSLQLSGQDTNMTSSNSCHSVGAFSVDLEPMARLQMKNNQSESQNISAATQPPSKHSQEEESGQCHLGVSLCPLKNGGKLDY
jgi:hypothetical protein